MLPTTPARLLALIAILLMSAISHADAQSAVRKNIDLLTPTELAAYEHAIQILKDRSAADPFDKTGYLWQAWVHNCPFIKQPASGSGPHSDRCDPTATPPDPAFIRTHPGVCEHGKDLFLIWHRAQFYYFEQILRAADPDGTIKDSRGVTGPSTRDVAVPYWNWTRKPTGVRYPKAFEQDGSPLNHGARNRDALTPDDQEAFKQITSPDAVAALVYQAGWQEFGGFPQESQVGGHGRFEREHHDPMHGGYIGGDMANSSRAALDPIFFSFHSYIDLVLQFWLDQHGPATVTSLEHFLRATQPDSVKPAPGHVAGAGLPSMGQGKIYLDMARLGYSYEVTEADKLPRPDAVAALTTLNGNPVLFAATEKSPRARLAGDGLFDPRRGPPTMISKIAVRVPSAVNGARAVFSRPHDAIDVTFAVDFYLHPANVDLDLSNKPQREKYIVVTGGHFGRGDEPAHDHGAKPLDADMSKPLKDLAATGHAGEDWTLTAVVSGQPPAPAFGTLSFAP
jgi:tyrosinase